MAMCFILSLVGLVSCGSYAGEVVIYFFPPEMNIENCIMNSPKVLIHPYVSSLIMLINATGMLQALSSLVPPWHKKKQPMCADTVKRALRQPVPGWQGMWKDLGRLLGQLSPPMA